MANFKGGYKIVSLQNNDLASDFTLEGLHEALANSYQKPILVEDIVISTEKKNDAYAVVNKSGTSYVIEVYNKILTVTSADAVTVTTKVEIDSIGDGLDLTDGELSATGGGGSTLYMHPIRIKSSSPKTYDILINIINDKATAYTDISEVVDYLLSKGKSEAYLTANGVYDSRVLVGFGVDVGYDTTFNIRVITSSALMSETPAVTTVSSFEDKVYAL